MDKKTDGRAVVYCQDAFNTTNGKTAHGLIRFTNRYDVLSVIDSNYAGKDTGEILDGKKNNILVTENLQEALFNAKKSGIEITHFVIGLAPDGGRLPDNAKLAVKEALKRGLNVDSGLHDFLSEDIELLELAKEKGVSIRDIRKTPDRDKLHFFTGNIEKVDSLKIAVLGTDSAIGKRTTAWIIVNALIERGISAELIGTGQTAWMQGAEYTLIMDSLINDFVSGEIEHAIFSAWENNKPKVIVIEGQGSLLNPAYPGGFEILAAGRPDFVILQHAPARTEYDGFPGFVLHPLERQIEAIEIISDKKVEVVTINHENLTEKEIDDCIEDIKNKTGLQVYDVLKYGAENLVEYIIEKLSNRTLTKYFELKWKQRNIFSQN